MSSAHLGSGSVSISSASAAAVASISFGLVARIQAKAGHEQTVAEFLKNGLALTEQEKHTVTWYAVQFSSNEFGVFDTFHSESDIEAHLHGSMGSQLPIMVAKGIIQPPEVEKVRIFGTKLTIPKPGENQLALLARLTPTSVDHTQAVHDFLRNSAVVAHAELATNTWYAFKFADGSFGVFDSFANEEGIEARLKGKIGVEVAALEQKKILTRKLEKLQILAAKLP